MIEAFRLGGWGMFFILIFGLLAISGAARFAWRGDISLALFARWGCLTTVSSAVFAFLTGMLKVCHYVVFLAKPEERWIVLVEGTSEAMNCLSFGALLATLICLLLAIGYRRFPQVETARAA